jgi:3',5'-cyclic AMP phosphodiesterase CpdA
MKPAPLAALLVALAAASCKSTPPAVFPGEVRRTAGFFAVASDTRGWIAGEMWREPSGFERRAVVAKLAEERPDFIVNGGDVVSAGSYRSQWEIFDLESKSMRDAGIAYLPVLGNHDLWPDKREGLANWHARFPHLGGRRWNEFRYGAVSLLLVDSNATELSIEEERQQDEWFVARLDAAEADASVRCVMVVCHHPVMTNSIARGNESWVRSHFVEPAKRHGKAKLFITAHVHSYEHFAGEGIHYLVSGGGGAPLMDVAGPKGPEKDLYDGPRGHHFCRIAPREDRIDVEMVRLGDDGGWTVADKWSIKL